MWLLQWQVTYNMFFCTSCVGFFRCTCTCTCWEIQFIRNLISTLIFIKGGQTFVSSGISTTTNKEKKQVEDLLLVCENKKKSTAPSLPNYLVPQCMLPPWPLLLPSSIPHSSRKTNLDNIVVWLCWSTSNEVKSQLLHTAGSLPVSLLCETVTAWLLPQSVSLPVSPQPAPPASPGAAASRAVWPWLSSQVLSVRWSPSDWRDSSPLAGLGEQSSGSGEGHRTHRTQESLTKNFFSHLINGAKILSLINFWFVYSCDRIKWKS